MSFIIFIIVLSVLILVHEFGHFAAAKRCGVKVEIFSLGYGPRIIGIKKHDTDYRISAVPCGGYVKMAGETAEDNPTGAKWEFLSRPIAQRFGIVISGALLNYILGFVLFSLVFMLGVPVSKNTNRIGSLMKGYPAAAHGVRAGDAIIAVDGQKTQTWEELVGTIHKKTQGDITLTIKRDEELLDIALTPKVERKFVFDNGKSVALIGIKPEYDVRRYGFFESIKLGGLKIIVLTTATFNALGLMITGRISPSEISGPVGIFVMTSEMAKLGFIYLLDFIGLISASLAIFNVLPIPVLDGGHLVFMAIEKIRGKPVSLNVQEGATQVGLFVLIALIIFVFYSDFVKFSVIDRILAVFGK